MKTICINDTFCGKIHKGRIYTVNKVLTFEEIIGYNRESLPLGRADKWYFIEEVDFSYDSRRFKLVDINNNIEVL